MITISSRRSLEAPPLAPIDEPLSDAERRRRARILSCFPGAWALRRGYKPKFTENVELHMDGDAALLSIPNQTVRSVAFVVNKNADGEVTSERLLIRLPGADEDDWAVRPDLLASFVAALRAGTVDAWGGA